MKILKIELQNINSLKSDTPICINFESDSFKDVGLYAITGATGAGKTTILDAITIALYHNVPRFKGTKATLTDVVSFGAKDAFSRITFENENTIYEAFWSIRLASNNGKILKNPQEEVSLKNISSKKIVASQKRAVITNILKVTQLDYDQFLRSVLLAQGEFASFLTAKGPEKGKLLEQITGEEIYKKIGQAILDRKSSEENKLKEIEAKINADDILTEEQKLELLKKQKELDVNTKITEKEIQESEVIFNWYKKYQELKNETNQLKELSEQIEKQVLHYKNDFNLLALDKKAEPFKELLENLKRNEKNAVEKEYQFKILEEDLKLLSPKITSLKQRLHQENIDVENAKKEFQQWLPKFDLITKFDNQITNENQHKKREITALEKIAEEVKSFQKKTNSLQKTINEIKQHIKIDEKFVLDNDFLVSVDLELSDWTTNLTKLNTHKKTLLEKKTFISLKNKELATSKIDNLSNKKTLDAKLTAIKKIENEILDISKKLGKKNTVTIISEIKKLQELKDKWQKFETLAREVIKHQKEIESLETQQRSYLNSLKSLEQNLLKITKQIDDQEKSVIDAEKILALEKSIAKYEEDRMDLINGKPCGLCGATHHPFAEHLPEITLSKTERDLKKRKELLQKLINSKTFSEKEEIKINTSLESLKLQTDAISKNSNENFKAIQLLNIDCDINNSFKITEKINAISKEIKTLESDVKQLQQLQDQKNDLSNLYSKEQKIIGELNENNAKLQEKIKNLTSEIEVTQQTITSLENICNVLENDLNVKLAKYKYELPTIENTSTFIKNIEYTIAEFNKTVKNLNELKSKHKILEHDFIANNKQINRLEQNGKDVKTAITNYNTKLESLTKKRSDILPLTISIDTKREQLLSSNKKLDEKLASTQSILQKQLDAKTEKETLKNKNNTEQIDLKTEHKKLQQLLSEKLKISDFKTRNDIEKALLTQEDKLKYTQHKDYITKEKIKLETKKESNIKAKHQLELSKNFTISEEDIKKKIVFLKSKKEAEIAKTGEVKEAFRKDQEIRDRNKEITKKIDAQNKILNVWKELFKIIGNSKDAFNTYVQRLTLQNLLDLANIHLYKLNKRYSLKLEENYKPKEELNFSLIDHYQTDQTRLVDTSSGGEKFIISLALALGLSDLASKNVKIDSLFIDEGFGTLDSNTLETVIATLETLQSQGKKIGIISHVENLKERIPTQIQITKKSNGVSVVNLS